MIVEFDEDSFLALLAKDRTFFRLAIDMNIKPWFFRHEENKNIYKEIVRLVEQHSFDSYKPFFISQNSEMSKVFARLIASDTGSAMEIYNEDDLVFMNDVNSYKDESRRYFFSKISIGIEERIKNGKNYHDLIEMLDDLHESTRNLNMMAMDEIAHAIETEVKGRVYGTGIEGLDSKVEITDSYLVVVAGESSSGKTTLAVQIMNRFVADSRLNGIIYSLETSQTRLGKRMIKHIGFESKKVEDEAHEILKDMGDRMKVVGQVTEVSDIIKSIKDEVKRDDNLKFVCIDYLQIIDCEGIHEETPRVARVVKMLHQLAQELGIVMILLCQLKKEDYRKEKGESKRSAPTMQSLRGSAQIVNSADVILINWFQQVFNDNSVWRPVNIEIVKNKEGQQGRSLCEFSGQFFTFRDKEKQ